MIRGQRGHPPVPFWIPIEGLPYRLFKPQEQRRLADDLGGGILLDLSLSFRFHLPQNEDRYIYVTRMLYLNIEKPNLLMKMEM
jgi:hypothetical protein